MVDPIRHTIGTGGHALRRYIRNRGITPLVDIPWKARGSHQKPVSPGWFPETQNPGEIHADKEHRCWLRQLPSDHIYMQEEILGIDTAVEQQRASVGLGFWQPFKALGNNRRVLYRFILGGLLFLFQNASGINAINCECTEISCLQILIPRLDYSPTIFKSIGIVGTSTSLLTTGVFGVVKTLGALIWLFILVDKAGRRNLLMIGAAGGSVCMWYIGAYIKIADPSKNFVKDPTTGELVSTGTLSGGGISAMFFFYLWTCFYSPTWNGTPWVLNSEMFDQNVRTLAQAFAAANNWVSRRLPPQRSKNQVLIH